MPLKDPRVDAYIKKSPEFAQPILKHLRQLIHHTCPGVQEAIKWGSPFFDYEGSVLCAIAAFKHHCRLIFWKAKMMQDTEGLMQVTEKHSNGAINNITSLQDLPPDSTLIKYMQEAMKLNESNVKLPAKKAAATQPEMPVDFAAALQKNKKAHDVFEKFTPGKKKEYIQWITEAKTEATAIKRIETAIEWIGEGKSRNWKYEIKK